MERYSLLYGTLQSGNTNQYTQLGVSAGASAFFTQIGAVSPAMTMDIVRNLLGSFTALGGYEQQPVDDKPVTVRYAPMHLYRRPDMPRNLQPFNALCISGAENRVGERDGKYSHTVFLSQACLHKSGVYNYLDQIFGTHLTSYQEMDAHVKKTSQINVDALPRHVDPEMRQMDSRYVVLAAAAIYQRKSVIIRLEKDCGFNRRAWELLTQIYALLHPQLAAEIGFASYQNPAEIAELKKNTSIRVFVLPAACQLPEATADTLELDLAAEPAFVSMDESAFSKELLQSVQAWCGLAWKERSGVMEELFAEVEDYHNSEVFVQKTKDFFMDPSLKWLRTLPEKGTVETLEDLWKLYQAHPVCTKLTIMRENFKRCAPALMSKKVKLSELVAKAGADSIIAAANKNQEEAAARYQLYEFGRWVTGKDVAKPVAEMVGNYAIKVTTDQKNQEIAAIQADNLQKLAAEKQVQEELKNRHAGEIQNLQLQAAEAQNKLRTQCAEALQAKNDELAAKTAQLAEQDRAHQSELAAQNASFAAKTQELVDQHNLAMQNQKAGYETRLQDMGGQLALAKEGQQQLTTRLQGMEAETEKLRKENARMKDILSGVPVEPEEPEIAEEPKTRGWKILGIKFPAEHLKAFLVSLGAGFLAALLICGLIWLTVALISGGKEEEEAPPVMQEEQQTPDPVTPEDPVVPEETDDPVVPEEPDETEQQEQQEEQQPVEPVIDYSDWTQQATADQLKLDVPDLQTVEIGDAVTAGLEAAQVTIAAEGYTPVALLSTQPTAGGAAELDVFAVLLQKTAEDAVLNPPAPEASEEQQTPPEETENDDPQPETAALAMTIDAGAFAVLVYGGEDMCAAALQTTAVLLDAGTEASAEPQVLLQLADQGSADLTKLMGRTLADANWWRNVETVSTDEATLGLVQTKYPDVSVLAVITVQGQAYYLTDCGTEEEPAMQLPAGCDVVVVDQYAVVSKEELDSAEVASAEDSETKE